jgi:DNA-binding response OmpR family regulator
MADRAQHLNLAGVEVVVQGAWIEVGGREVRLTRRERLLLDFLLRSEGTILSKSRLSQVAWEAGVEEHTVEVAVSRLRSKLGPAGAALETTNGRGYRLITRVA